MDLRENTYYLILFTFLLFAVIGAVYVVGKNIYEIHTSYTLASQLSNFLYEGSSIYYLGSYSYFENDLFVDHDCYSQYDGGVSQKIICDNKPVPYYKTSYPLLLDLTAKNKYILIERGYISYGPYSYFYLTVTNKKLVIFEIDVQNKELIEAGFKNIIKSVPTNYVVGICSNNRALLWVDQSKDITKSDLSDFMTY
ncbi:MAG: hypothetical protein GXN99_01170, partial [Candidatus Nanohaloarchaeota archaeon]|nr:hypothetical protein [Candidatus Nanohaloarchaeota archaeon]